MDSKLILEAARGTLDGSLSFPEVVGKLLAAGVEYYHVDYVRLRKRFYSADGEMMATSINYEGLPPARTLHRYGNRGPDAGRRFNRAVISNSGRIPQMPRSHRSGGF